MYLHSFGSKRKSDS